MQDQAYRVVVEERIAELWRWRSWWRANRWADWPQVRHDLHTELHALIRVARRARRISRAARSLPDGDHFLRPADTSRSEVTA